MELVATPTFYGINLESHGQILHQAAALADAGRLRPHLYQVMELEDLAEAHRLQDTGHVNGKIVLRVK